ncbi:MAG: V-type ATP synthase subunit E [Clostridia bacterium]|nr:V-type ATP synthase subunit E [Clostridia bacterium]
MAEIGVKSAAFFKAINDASRSHNDAIIKETENFKLQQLEKAKADAQKLYDEYVIAATERIALEDGIEAQKLSLLHKKQVIQARQEITDSVFANVTERIKEFTKTDAYGEMLVASAKKMVQLCDGCRIIIYMRSEDAKYENAIKAVSENISTAVDGSITLGGIYCVCNEKSIRLNDCLETKLENQKEWFYENSGLYLR